MRRILSILVMLVLGLGPSVATVPAAALASGWTGKVDESHLPSCCRRHGKHQCAMDSQGQDSQGQTIAPSRETAVGANDSCPFMPHALASTAPSVTALLRDSAISMLLPAESSSPHSGTAVARVTDRRSWPKRGPPALQIL